MKESKSALELIQCAILGNADQKQIRTQLLTRKLELLKHKLDDEEMKHDLASLDMEADSNEMQS